MFCFGNRVSTEFRNRVRGMALALGLPPRDDNGPSWLMAVMAFETGETFSPAVRNAAGSGAVGLIQFMPQTASMLRTTTDALARMDAIRQLDYVEDYLTIVSLRRRLENLGDLYLAILWPAGIGKPDDTVIFARGGDAPKLYLQNRGLDLDRDGDITRGEIVAKVQEKYERGMKFPHVYAEAS
jgi:hypothetical protein